MYNKLKFIKMFLATILMSLTLISIMKSCAYAWTFEDFIQFCNYTKDNNIVPTSNNNQNVINNRNRFLNDINGFYTYCQNNNIDLTLYNSFIVGCTNKSNAYEIMLFVMNDNSTLTITSNKTAEFKNLGTRVLIQHQNNTYTQYSMTTYFSETAGVGFMGLTAKNPNTWGSYILQQKFMYVNGIENPNIDPLPILIGQAQARKQLHKHFNRI